MNSDSSVVHDLSLERDSSVDGRSGSFKGSLEVGSSSFGQFKCEFPSSHGSVSLHDFQVQVPESIEGRESMFEGLSGLDGL